MDVRVDGSGWFSDILVSCEKCDAEPGEQCRGLWAFLSGRPHVERILAANGIRKGTTR